MLFRSADLAVLAVPPADYQHNTARVRAEYGHVSDADFGLWRGLLNWFRRFVVAATPGNGNETWHTAVCR